MLFYTEVLPCVSVLCRIVQRCLGTDGHGLRNAKVRSFCLVLVNFWVLHSVTSFYNVCILGGGLFFTLHFLQLQTVPSPALSKFSVTSFEILLKIKLLSGLKAHLSSKTYRIFSYFSIYYFSNFSAIFQIFA